MSVKNERPPDYLVEMFKSDKLMFKVRRYITDKESKVKQRMQDKDWLSKTQRKERAKKKVEAKKSRKKNKLEVKRNQYAKPKFDKVNGKNKVKSKKWLFACFHSVLIFGSIFLEHLTISQTTKFYNISNKAIIPNAIAIPIQRKIMPIVSDMPVSKLPRGATWAGFRVVYTVRKFSGGTGSWMVRTWLWCSSKLKTTTRKSVRGKWLQRRKNCQWKLGLMRNRNAASWCVWRQAFAHVIERFVICMFCVIIHS